MPSNDFYVSLGQKLRARRRVKHMTLKEMADTLNKSVATLSKYEKGEILISIDVLIDICKTLDIDIASLLPDTCSVMNQKEIDRYQKYFSERLYLYWFNGEKNKIQKAVVENRSLSFRSTMYYDVPDINNYYEASFIYEGKVIYSDTSTVYTFTCTTPPFDILSIRIPFLKAYNTVKIGLLSTISYFYQSIAMKVAMSETPLKEDDNLLALLHISPEDIKNIKRTNFFLV